MSVDIRGQLELMMLTRHEDYQELSSKISLVNKQLNAKIDAINDRFSDLHQKIMTMTNKQNLPAKQAPASMSQVASPCRVPA
jgi:hypothetical protein